MDLKRKVCACVSVNEIKEAFGQGEEQNKLKLGLEWQSSIMIRLNDRIKSTKKSTAYG